MARGALLSGLRDLGVEDSQVADFLKRKSNLVIEQILTAKGKGALLARLRDLGVEDSQVADFLKRKSHLVIEQIMTAWWK